MAETISMKMAHDAEKIANIFVKTATEQRGDLMESIAGVLRLKSQFYTGHLFHQIAEAYGSSKKTT